MTWNTDSAGRLLIVPGLRHPLAHRLCIDCWRHYQERTSTLEVIMHCPTCDISGYRENFDNAALALDHQLCLPQHAFAEAAHEARMLRQMEEDNRE